jgi:hypothetical protein
MMPLTIQLPDNAPINKSINNAGVTPAMLLTIAVSIVFHRVPHRYIAIKQHTADAVNKTIWLAPSNVSPPKTCIVTANNPTNTATGTNDNIGDGIFIVVLSFIFSFVCIIINFSAANVRKSQKIQ